MLQSNNKIVIIDNEPTELIELGKAFLEIGLACKTFEYDQFFSPPLEDVRIAFFDIKLNPGGGESEEQTFSNLVDAIKLYISPNNPPFALVFWTTNKNLILGFKKFILERKIDLPSPFFIDCIDKAEIKEPSILTEKLQRIFNEPSIKLLFDFETKAQIAASKTVDRIFKIIPSDDLWSESGSFCGNFVKVFSKIASQTLGFESAKENTSRAVYEALLPILFHDFFSLETSDAWKDNLGPLKSAKKAIDLSYPEEFDQSKLNSIFHIDESKSIPKNSRGAVILLTLQDEDFRKSFNIAFQDWFSRFLPGLTTDDRKASKLIAVEISSSCDFAQKKPRIHKYMLGVLLEESSFNNLDEKKAPQNLLELDGYYYIQNKKYKICLNLNYVSSLDLIIEKLNNTLFSFKKEMVDLIGNRYANHVSRIGITSF